MIRLVAGAVLLGLAGCTGFADVVKELGDDPAPLCLTVNSIYEHIELSRFHGCERAP